MLTKPVDTSKQAKRGAILKAYTDTEPTAIDAHLSGRGIAHYNEIAYSRLFAAKPGFMQLPEGEVVGADAESWEWSPDRLQLTAKLRPNVKFHNVPPVNGRDRTMDDVLFSWRRFQTIGSNRTTVANSANPNAPVLSLTATDSTTLVIKFAEPLVYAQDYFIHRGFVNIVPVEVETHNIDLRNIMIGTGPFAFVEWQPSTHLIFKRHEGYWNKTNPYIDQVNYPIIPEYATQSAQFRAGNIYTLASSYSSVNIRQEEVLSTKRDLPVLNLFELDIVADTQRMIYGWQEPALRDKRVRQAFSMAIDRDTWLEAALSISQFEAAGLTMQTRWNTALQADESVTGWWLNPKDKEFGPNARYYEYNVPEARKLMAAAGYPDGVELIANHINTTETGVEFIRLLPVWEQMAAEAGFRFKKNIITNREYVSTYRDSQGKWSGVSYKAGPPSPSDDPAERLSYEFTPRSNVGFLGFDVNGKGDGSGDPYVEAQLAKARIEVDKERRRSLIHDVQRYLAEQQYVTRWPGGATSFTLVWPVIQNYRVYRAVTATHELAFTTTWWLDETKEPVKRA